VKLAVIHVKHVPKVLNVKHVKVKEKVNYVNAQLVNTTMVTMIGIVMNVLTNVKHVPEQQNIVIFVLETELVNLHVLAHQEP